jgi:hypothetical protein
MARVQTDTGIRAEALRTVAAPKMQAVQVVADPNSNPAFQLAASLGAAGPALDRFQENYERRKLQDQLLKVDAYKERFKADNTSGAVSAAQVGKLFPETVPTIRARIAEGAGFDYGKTLIQPALETVLKDDAIRLDSAARAAYLKQQREQIIGGLQGDDFYKSGAIRAIDAELKTYENTWQTQTATYHNEIQKKDFRGKITEVFSANTDAASVTTALEALDAQWKASSSLNNLERNQLVIDEVTKLAFSSDNPAMLDLIPQRFLNTESKAELKQAKVAIQTKRITDFRNEQYLIGVERERGVRQGKMDMINSVVDGKPIDPAAYRSEPELFAFAMEMKDVNRLPEVESVASAQRMRTSILDGSTVAGLNQDQLVGMIQNDKRINPKEKKALIEEVPKLIEGRIAMDDPMVKNVIDLRINPALQALERSTNSTIQRIMTGENLRGQAIRMFEMGVRNAFEAYYQDNKSWPTGRAKLDIIDAQTEKAELYIAKRTKGVDTPTPAPAAPATSAPAPAQQNNRPAPTQEDISFIRNSETAVREGRMPQQTLDSYKAKFRQRFGREP